MVEAFVLPAVAPLKNSVVGLRAVISVPKAAIDKEEAREQKRKKRTTKINKKLTRWSKVYG